MWCMRCGCRRCCCRQDLEMVWPLQLLAKRERGPMKTVFRCVSRGCANAQHQGKRKEKKKKKKRERKKKECGLTVSLYIGFMALAVRCQWSLYGSKGMVGHMPTTGRTQKPWGGGHAGDGCNMGASGHCRDLMLAQKLELLARQGWGCARLVFRCVSRGSANAWDWKKKNESEKNNQKKKAKNGLTSSNPHKNTNFHRSCMRCVCVASVRVGSEACGGGIHRDGIRQVFIGTLQWHGCFNFWA